MKVLYLIVALIVAVCLSALIKKQTYTEMTGGAQWFRSPKCKYQMNAILRQTLDKNSINHRDDGELMFPCTYNYTGDEIDQLLNHIKTKGGKKKIFIIGEGDQISNKMTLWVNLRNRFGLRRASKMMPMTYVLSDSDDMSRFKNDYTRESVYIMKKNIQRQEGLLVTRDLNKIMKGAKEGYVIVQKMLQDPYLIENRKINVRIYMLIVCDGEHLSGYIHNNGFMYYTPKSFKRDSVDLGEIITTGYIDRSVYKRNPLTLIDFRRYLDDLDRSKTEIERSLIDKKGSLSILLFNRVSKLLRKTVEAVKPRVCQNNDLKRHLTFQLYGVDLAINNRLHPSLMEINKGPDMGAKDDRDKMVKSEVTNDILKVIDVIPNDKHGFIKIY